MRDSGIEIEAETDVFHARVIHAWGEDADEEIAVSTPRQPSFPQIGLL